MPVRGRLADDVSLPLARGLKVAHPVTIICWFTTNFNQVSRHRLSGVCVAVAATGGHLIVCAQGVCV